MGQEVEVVCDMEVMRGGQGEFSQVLWGCSRLKAPVDAPVGGGGKGALVVLEGGAAW